MNGKSEQIAAEPGIHQHEYASPPGQHDRARGKEFGLGGTGATTTCFTLNTADRHAVAYLHDHRQFHRGIRGKGVYADGAGIMKICNRILAAAYNRRLTPTERARLQGFQTGGVRFDTPHPTQEEILWWSDVFETHRKIMGTSTKPKSRKQIVKWVQSPRSDSAGVQDVGNGVALPRVCFVLAGIVDLACGGMT